MTVPHQVPRQQGRGPARQASPAAVATAGYRARGVQAASSRVSLPDRRVPRVLTSTRGPAPTWRPGDPLLSDCHLDGTVPTAIRGAPLVALAFSVPCLHDTMVHTGKPKFPCSPPPPTPSRLLMVIARGISLLTAAPTATHAARTVSQSKALYLGPSKLHRDTPRHRSYMIRRCHCILPQRSRVLRHQGIRYDMFHQAPGQYVR